MNQVMIEFSGNKKVASLQAGLLVFVSGLMFVFAGWEYYVVNQEMKSVAQQLEDWRLTQEKIKHGETLPAERNISASEIEVINHAVSQMNLPWRELFGVFEAHQNKGIALIALDPDSHKRLLSITAEAKTPEDMADYLEALSSEKFFIRVILTRHELNEQDPNHPIRFTMEASWAHET